MTPRCLEGPQFVRVFPRVYRHRDHTMRGQDWRTAARLALPGHAHLTGLSRLQALGLDHGSDLPVRFVVEGDLHLAFDGIFLHRTRRLPPVDEAGVTPASAFTAFCARSRVIDAVKVGDWLLAGGWSSVDEIRTVALDAPWRAGADEALWVLDHLDPAARSLPESEVRCLLRFAGLPAPEVNTVLEPAGLTGDLVFRPWRAVVEHEGVHHQTSRRQYVTDVDRYAVYRATDVAYVQVTSEKLRRPRRVVEEVHKMLVARGYDGPEPTFRGRWDLLFAPLSAAVGPRWPPPVRR